MSSARARRVDLVLENGSVSLLTPPSTIAEPSGSATVAAHLRGLLRLSAAVHVSVAGSKRSTRSLPGPAPLSRRHRPRGRRRCRRRAPCRRREPRRRTPRAREVSGPTAPDGLRCRRECRRRASRCRSRGGGTCGDDGAGRAGRDDSRHRRCWTGVRCRTRCAARREDPEDAEHREPGGHVRCLRFADLAEGHFGRECRWDGSGPLAVSGARAATGARALQARLVAVAREAHALPEPEPVGAWRNGGARALGVPGPCGVGSGSSEPNRRAA